MRRVTICSGCQGCKPEDLERPELELAAERHLERRNLSDVVLVAPAICLDVCGDGVSLVVEPDSTWYSVETEADIEMVIDQHLVGGEVVSHLQIDPPE